MTNSQAVNCLPSSYLSDFIIPCIQSRALPPQNTGLLSVLKVNKESAVCRAFSYQAPFLWNNLPVEIGQSDCVEALKYR